MRYYQIIVWFMLGFVLFSLSSCSVQYQQARADRMLEKKGVYDAIIVPGRPYTEPTFSTWLEMRMLWAKYIFDRGYARHIIFTGNAVYTPYIEAEVMRIMADSMGLPPDRILIETCAEHSTENVFYGMQMARQHGFQKVALATDIFQIMYVRSFMRKHFKELELLPVNFAATDFKNVKLPAIDPEKALVKPFLKKEEKHTLIERLRGTRGRNINFNLYQTESTELNNQGQQPVNNILLD